MRITKVDEDDKGGTAQRDGWDLLAIPFGRSFQNACSPGLLGGQPRGDASGPSLWRARLGALPRGGWNGEAGGSAGGGTALWEDTGRARAARRKTILRLNTFVMRVCLMKKVLLFYSYFAKLAGLKSKKKYDRRSKCR
ncbi:hypothetical protein AV530_001979 [Patagioenas fasciata monilis]|uniref:Uncharacterized protein n=1 Tax=Patagioenas fasciata monilis TaxID=372326 RepID=A0A1V4J6K7_PATFA|nr:hypothetical protein AV530_001979 [Patagioenas fasciata monilis]